MHKDWQILHILFLTINFAIIFIFNHNWINWKTCLFYNYCVHSTIIILMQKKHYRSSHPGLSCTLEIFKFRVLMISKNISCTRFFFNGKQWIKRIGPNSQRRFVDKPRFGDKPPFVSTNLLLFFLQRFVKTRRNASFDAHKPRFVDKPPLWIRALMSVRISFPLHDFVVMQLAPQLTSTTKPQKFDLTKLFFSAWNHYLSQPTLFNWIVDCFWKVEYIETETKL